MSFILSGSLHHFSNCRISHANIRLLRFYSGKCLSNQCKIRPLTTRVEVTRKRSQNSTPESIKLRINQTKILKPHIEPIRCYPALSKERKEAKIDRPVTILAFDIETTGFNTPAERIVEFAARNLIGGRYSTFQTLIDPQKIIRNSDIHGITNSMIKQAGAPRYATKDNLKRR